MSPDILKKIQFADFEVDFSQHEVRKRGMRVRLQHKPFQILELLLRRPGCLVTREEIAKCLWPDSHVCVERGLNTAMNALRQVLGDTSHASRFIETRAGLGYCFIAPLNEISERNTGSISQVRHSCLKGHFFLDRMTEDDARKGLAHFESALSDDGCSEALVYAGMTDAWCEFAGLSMAPARVAGVKAKEFAILSLRHDAKSSAAHLAMARVKMLFDWDWASADIAFKRALDLSPDSAAAHRHYAACLSLTQESQSALEHIRIAQSLQPLSLPIGVGLAWLFYVARSFEAAAEECWKVLALEPRFWPAQLLLGLAYRQMGMQEEAMAEVGNAAACSGRNPIALGMLGHVGGDATEVLTELQEQSERRYVNPLSWALAYSGAEQASSAYEWTQKAFDARDTSLLWLGRGPLLDSFIPKSMWSRFDVKPTYAATTGGA